MNRIKTIVEKNNSEHNNKREERRAGRNERVASRRQWRIDKINALKEKFYAVAAKRKWLVFLLGLAIIIYFIFSSGGFGGLGGVLEKVKGFF